MADDFWKAVYDKLIDNMELLKLICRDTSNADLLAWVKPNSRLKTRCARYLKNGFIADREGIINEMLSYAKTDNPLRRIILLTWVDKNQASMAFFKIPGNQAAIERLGKGEFGNSEKIRILSYIDPREGSAKLYKDILEKADAEAKQKSEEEKAAQALAAMGTVDSAELEAALHAKEMIAAPDTNDGTTNSNFNEVILEELEKIKAALEILQDVNKQLKDENKDLRSEKSKRQTEVANYSSKLESSVKEARKLSSELAQAKEANVRLKTQLEAAKTEIASIPAPTLTDSEINDLRFRLDEALKQNEKLQQIINNREASLERIKAENQELHSKSDNISDQSQTVANLQHKLAELQQKQNVKTTEVVGQIITKTRFPEEFGEKAGKKCWLFISITEQVRYIDLNDIPSAMAVPEEFMIASFEGDRLVSINSLETERKEVYGFVKLEDGHGILVCDEDGELPIMLEITEKWAGRPARGVYLPEYEKREGGVYKLDILPATANLNKTAPKAAKKASDKTENKTEADVKFNGQKVAIFGGDRVGLEYERALANAGLEAKWFSGFNLLSEISLGGFGKPDLMIIVTKQVSHALLRELNAYAEKKSIQVAYSTRRGITSVLDLVAKSLKSPL